MYSLQGLEKAKEELSRIENSWNNYSGNNPNKFRSKLKNARDMVKIIEHQLKVSGILPYTEKELLDKQLDLEFPNAQSKEIVFFNEIRYQRIFFKNSDGWVKIWIEVPITEKIKSTID